MKQKTILYEALEAAGAKTQYDEHVKRLLGFRPVISQILIRTMTEYAGRTAKEAAAWIEPEELFFAREGEADGSSEKRRRAGGREREAPFMTCAFRCRCQSKRCQGGRRQKGVRQSRTKKAPLFL